MRGERARGRPAAAVRRAGTPGSGRLAGSRCGGARRRYRGLAARLAQAPRWERPRPPWGLCPALAGIAGSSGRERLPGAPPGLGAGRIDPSSHCRPFAVRQEKKKNIRISIPCSQRFEFPEDESEPWFVKQTLSFKRFWSQGSALATWERFCVLLFPVLHNSPKGDSNEVRAFFAVPAVRGSEDVALGCGRGDSD